MNDPTDELIALIKATEYKIAAQYGYTSDQWDWLEQRARFGSVLSRKELENFQNIIFESQQMTIIPPGKPIGLKGLK